MTDELPILIAGDAERPERLVLLSRPDGGRVSVREWTSSDWSRPPAARTMESRELLAELEQAIRQGRRVNQEIYAVRHWLGLPG